MSEPLPKNLDRRDFRTLDGEQQARALVVKGMPSEEKVGFLGAAGTYQGIPGRLEGPSFVWYFRGRPHVHVWVNVADSASVKLNSYQNSLL